MYTAVYRYVYGSRYMCGLLKCMSASVSSYMQVHVCMCMYNRCMWVNAGV